MVRQKTPSNNHKPLVIFLFHFLLFSYPLLSLLWRRSYPLLTVEVGVLFLSLAAFCGLLALILSNVRPAIVNVLSPLLITISIMLQFDILLMGVILYTLLGLVVAWRLGTNFQLYSLPVLLTLILGAYFDSYEDSGYIHNVEQPSTQSAKLPPIVHIILDSFIGIEGLPPYPASKILSDELYTFFDDYNFRVFPRAYSRFWATGDSLYSALNFRNGSESVFGLEEAGRSDHILTSNSQFDVMQELGYRFNIYQTGHLNYCQSNSGFVDRCWEYPQPNAESIKLVSDIQLKLRMLLKVLVGQSKILSDLVVSKAWLLDQGIANHDPRIFSALESDLDTNYSGKYFFAHVLLPHGPFAFMSDCSVNYASPVWARYPHASKDITDTVNYKNANEVFEIRTMKYFEQVDCAVKSVGKIFDKMKVAGIYDQSIIVLHGDHGSMIGLNQPVNENLKKLTPAEYRANYSILFAVKFPGDKEKVDYRVLPLSTLLEEFSGTVQASISGKDSLVLMRTVPNTPEKVGSFVYLQGANPMWKVEVDIFKD